MTLAVNAGISPARRASGRKAIGEKQPLDRVLPPDQRLHRHHLLRTGLDLGLVPDDQLVVSDRLAKVVAAAQPLAREAVLRRVEEQSARPGELRLVHRDVGAAQELGRGHVVGLADRDAHRGVDRQVEALDPQGRAKHCANLVRDLQEVHRRVARHEQRELVSAQARDDDMTIQSPPHAQTE